MSHHGCTCERCEAYDKDQIRIKREEKKKAAEKYKADVNRLIKATIRVFDVRCNMGVNKVTYVNSADLLAMGKILEEMGIITTVE